MDVFFFFPEEIPSDEDEAGEKSCSMQPSSAPRGNGNDDEDEDDDDEDYWDEDGLEGTALEEYSTPLDYDNGEDEYQFFSASVLRTWSSDLLSLSRFTIIPDSFTKCRCLIKMYVSNRSYQSLLRSLMTNHY